MWGDSGDPPALATTAAGNVFDQIKQVLLHLYRFGPTQGWSSNCNPFAIYQVNGGVPSLPTYPSDLSLPLPSPQQAFHLYLFFLHLNFQVLPTFPAQHLLAFEGHAGMLGGL